MALKVLREILRHQPARFKNYAELTVMKTLEAHKDPHKEVSDLTVLLILLHETYKRCLEVLLASIFLMFKVVSD